MVDELTTTILTAWRDTVRVVSNDDTGQFLGRDKESRVFRRLRQEVELRLADCHIVGPDFQRRFKSYSIDLVCGKQERRVAVEGKYKTLRDGAIPDNRKAAFFDLFKLEQYLSEEYGCGLFLWLTDNRAYLRLASGDSIDFSTHQGRIYTSGTPLHASRSRNLMPLPLMLTGQYTFDWEHFGDWHSLAIHVTTNGCRTT